MSGISVGPRAEDRAWKLTLLAVVRDDEYGAWPVDKITTNCSRSISFVR